MKQFLFISLLWISTLSPCLAQEQIHVRIPKNHTLKLYISYADPKADLGSDRLAILNDPTNQYKIARFVFAIARSSGSASYLENISGERISSSARVEMAKSKKGDRWDFTQVMVRDKNGKEFEVDGISLVVK